MWKSEPAVLGFLNKVSALSEGSPGHVVELGSYAMWDHNPRSLFLDREYIGIDPRPGPGVDIVALSTDPLPSKCSNAAITLSISALEHDPFWRQTLGVMVTLLGPGGVIGVTVPSGNWVPHEIECAPDGKHYRNLEMDEVVQEILLSAAVNCRPLRQLETWTTRRALAPHWPRSNVVARFGP